MDRTTEETFLSSFPWLAHSPDALVKEILDASVFRTAAANTTLKTEGEFCNEFVFLCTGEKRVFKRSDSGREVTLYEMGPGDICVLNASCILSNTPLPANAASLTDVGMVLTPAQVFLKLVTAHEPLRTFVFSRINSGFVSIMSLVSEIVFSRMGERLRDYLLEKSEDGVLDTTHQRIADDLGTSREVISRLLKELERSGAVALARHRIRLNDLP